MMCSIHWLCLFISSTVKLGLEPQTQSEWEVMLTSLTLSGLVCFHTSDIEVEQTAWNNPVVPNTVW